jgi:hypothetical protein
VNQASGKIVHFVNNVNFQQHNKVKWIMKNKDVGVSMLGMFINNTQEKSITLLIVKKCLCLD